MRNPSMKRYYIGFAILTLAVLSIAIVVISKGAAGKQDIQTNKKAQEAVSKINSYLSKNRTIPDSLSEAGVTDSPDTIAFTKLSEEEFKFCVTYKDDKSYGGNDLTGVLWGAALRDASFEENDSYYNDTEYSRSYLYLPYTYKKGENCQTIKPILRSSNIYSGQQSGTSTNTLATNKTYDTERKTDLNNIHAQLETYYVQKGKYPTLANLNDATWRATNMTGLSETALKDPEGYSTRMLNSPYKGYYGYKVTTSDDLTCDNATKDCTKYTLSALLSDGTKYSKTSLN